MARRYGLRPDLDEMRAAADATRLRRTLGAWQLTLLGVGAIVGAGVFSVIGVAAATATGPAIVIAILGTAVVALLAALVYAELAAMIPLGGSAYTYASAAGGELFAWLVGWSLILSYGIGNAALASSFSDNFSGLLATFGWIIPDAWSATPANGGVMDLPALLVVVAITLLLLRPTNESALVNAILVAVKVLVLAVFLFVALPRADASNLQPFAPFGTAGILAGAAYMFFSFLGFDAVSTAAEETKNPQRDLPRGILGSIAVVTVLFVVVGFALTAIVPYASLNNGEPLAVALREAGFPWLGAVMNLGAILASLSVLLVFQLATVRVVLALARDGLVPRGMAAVNDKTGTPNRLTLTLGVLVAIGAAVLPLGLLVLLTTLSTLYIFSAAMVALIVLRKRAPDTPRPFRAPLVPLVPLAGIAACGVLAVYGIIEEPVSGTGFLAWMGIGVMVYAAYGARHSALRRRAEAQARAEPSAAADAGDADASSDIRPTG